MSPIDTIPAPDPGDAEIVRLLRERDGSGLRLLLTNHGDRVRGGLKKTFGGSLSDNEIDDALSTASYRAWRRIDSFDPAKGSLRAWFYVIARNAGQEMLRERQRLGWEARGEELERMPAPDRADDHAELVPAAPSAFLETLRQCIDALPRVQRRIIQEDLKSGDVADAGALAKALRTTRNSVYVSRSHARKALRKALLERGFALGDEAHRISWA